MLDECLNLLTVAGSRSTAELRNKLLLFLRMFSHLTALLRSVGLSKSGC